MYYLVIDFVDYLQLKQSVYRRNKAFVGLQGLVCVQLEVYQKTINIAGLNRVAYRFGAKTHP